MGLINPGVDGKCPPPEFWEEAPEGKKAIIGNVTIRIPKTDDPTFKNIPFPPEIHKLFPVS